ncbi:hypothetical protein BC830DRAFT_1215378 [Chytriomyces sp. MP71]|nr:hypothetical protein BC830DRAFT_1215378 [Chytriomyces sp. MP71]
MSFQVQGNFWGCTASSALFLNEAFMPWPLESHTELDQKLAKNGEHTQCRRRSSNKAVAGKKYPTPKRASGGVVKASKAAKGAASSVSVDEGDKAPEQAQSAKVVNEVEVEDSEEEEVETEGDGEEEAPPAREPFSHYEAAQESGLVLFFYPTNTPAIMWGASECKGVDGHDYWDTLTSTKTDKRGYACNYRDIVEKVHGVSADSEKSLTTWKTKQNYQYDFISDKERHIFQLFGVSKGDGVVRSQVLVAKEGA